MDEDSGSAAKHQMAKSLGPLFEAVDGSVGLMRELLEAGYPANAYGKSLGHGLVTSLALSVWRGAREKGDPGEALEMLDLLVEFGALAGEPLDAQGLCCMNRAAQGGWAQGVERLLAHGYPADGLKGAVETPLVTACRSGNVDVARRLLDAGADPDARGGLGISSLMYAASREHLGAVNMEKAVRIAEVLLAAGADADLADGAGRDAAWFSLNDEICGDTGAGAVAAAIEAWRLRNCLGGVGRKAGYGRPKAV